MLFRSQSGATSGWGTTASMRASKASARSIKCCNDGSEGVDISVAPLHIARPGTHETRFFRWLASARCGCSRESAVVQPPRVAAGGTRGVPCEHHEHVCKGAFGQGCGAPWGAEKRRACGRARSAHPHLARRNCSSAVNAANVASYATGPETEHRRAVGAQRRLPQRSAAACPDAPLPCEAPRAKRTSKLLQRADSSHLNRPRAAETRARLHPGSRRCE